MSVVLQCTKLDAGYTKGRPVVRGFDLTLNAGEVLALLGPNGAGKTTIMATLSGMIPRLAGTLHLEGHPLPSGNARAASRRGLVLVPDDRALFSGLTVKENLALSRRKGGTSLDKVLDYFPALKRRLGVSAGMLSGGEQQQLAIGRALMQDPRVLLIDELSMGLAPVVVENLLPVVRKVAADTGAAVVLVEQHVTLALQTADRALVVAHGSTLLEGSAADLLARPQLLEQAYLGDRSSQAG
ncbi:MAG: branched-chain amino acid transport system ATP-binding protein [Actinomycetota bacterium]|jgi:branched-chain amino acid transport system ATP-binding protein|nr:branched-chain amino acid transport system ATP-binding protein [Actinomycetota bacterium]